MNFQDLNYILYEAGVLKSLPLRQQRRTENTRLCETFETTELCMLTWGALQALSAKPTPALPAASHYLPLSTSSLIPIPVTNGSRYVLTNSRTKLVFPSNLERQV